MADLHCGRCSRAGTPGTGGEVHLSCYHLETLRVLICHRYRVPVFAGTSQFSRVPITRQNEGKCPTITNGLTPAINTLREHQIPPHPERWGGIGQRVEIKSSMNLGYMRLHRSHLRHLLCRRYILLFDLLEYNGSISQLIYGDSISWQKVQSISDSKWKFYSPVVIDVGQQMIHL